MQRMQLEQTLSNKCDNANSTKCTGKTFSQICDGNLSVLSRICDDGNNSAFEALAEYYPSVLPYKSNENLFGYIQ